MVEKEIMLNQMKEKETMFKQMTENRGILEKYDYNTTSHIEYLWYKVKGNKIIFPWRYYEMYLIDYLEDRNIEVEEKKGTCYCKILDNYLIDREGNKGCYIDELYQAQVYSFNAEKWYPEIEKLNIMVSKTFLFELSNEDFYDLEQSHNDSSFRGNLHTKLSNFLLQHPQIDFWFIKLGSVSPKDLFGGNGTCIKFNSSIQIIKALVESSRTWDTLQNGFEKCLVLKQWIDLPTELEFRCFIYNDTLRAISQYGYDSMSHMGYGSQSLYQYQSYDNQQDLILRIQQFYNSIRQYIPYPDCIMDIIVLDSLKDSSFNNLGIFLIEFNCFGAESPAGSALFNWILDSHILYSSSSPVLRLFSSSDLYSNSIQDVVLASNNSP